jgi:hypothetical protein
MLKLKYQTVEVHFSRAVLGSRAAVRIRCRVLTVEWQVPYANRVVPRFRSRARLARTARIQGWYQLQVRRDQLYEQAHRHQGLLQNEMQYQ